MFLRKTITIFVLSGVFFGKNKAVAQSFEIGVGGGVTHYKGEIYPRFKPLTFNAGGNAFVRYNISDAISIKATGMIANISAKDSRVNEPFHQTRGFAFKTLLYEAGGQIEYNFLNFRSRRAMYSSDWTPYVFGGVNYYSFLKRETNGDPAYTLTEKRGGTNYAIPFGIGIKKSINYNLNLSIEFGTRKTFSDTKLDYIGYDSIGDPYFFQGTTVPQNLVLARNLGHINSSKDMYYYTNISISYVFNKVHCPPSRKRRFIFF